MQNDAWYEQLPVVNRFADLSDPSVYHPLPADWSVAVSDVKDSTGLIRRGRYKQVNLVGASTIMALLNLQRSFSIPFIFGGDGASLCIPDSMVERARAALQATKRMAMDLYGIELRIGIVPVAFIREQGYDVLVARSRLSDSYSQAAFSGGGLQFAEESLKEAAVAERYAVAASVRPEGDFTGLECRWQNIPSAHGEIVSLIVQAVGRTNEERNSVYRQTLSIIGSIYGDDAQCHPVREDKLSMAMTERQLSGESGIRSYGKGRLYRLRYWFLIRWNVLLGLFLMATNYTTKFTEWGKYKQRLVQNTDFKKFDDKVRQVLSGSKAQRERLQSALELLRQEGKLVYGMHSAPQALMTCLLFNYNDAHVHLVDADDGGYAMAALQLKEQLRSTEAK